MEFMPIRPRPIVEWREDGTWKLLRNFTLGDISVPADFVFDGASVPRLLWPYADQEGPAFGAAVIHDYEYSTHPGTRKEADDRFFDNLRRYGIRRSKAWVMWFAVRSAGWASW